MTSPDILPRQSTISERCITMKSLNFMKALKRRNRNLTINRDRSIPAFRKTMDNVSV